MTLRKRCHEKKMAVYVWNKHFREGGTNIKDDLSIASSTTNENVEHFREIVCVDRRIIIDVFASQLGISHDSILSILHDDKIVFVCLWLQKNLSPEQNEMRVNMSSDLIDMLIQLTAFCRKILTSDETWCFLNNPQTKSQSSEWKGKT
ncbi:HTH_48 domain-containing protein [Trichonephila clavipes]|nr:HTH_48 domain-containing protein [Trichonephila clavipes]